MNLPRRYTAPLIAVFLLGWLAGCNTPKVGFRYSDQKALAIGQNHFIVYFNQQQAQAVRTNRTKLRHTGQVLSDAVVAIETATKCKVKPRSIRGDPGLIIARLKCL
ncbi:MAG: hypothetical protein GY947_04605 [Rhodobacteraceae bacterium]|nr:hypothetical protein [Paracoccaceae bacterium]